MLRDDGGEPKAFMALVEDVTDRKHAQEALRQSEEKHRGLLAACPDAVVMTDLNGTILFASHQTWELVGLSDQEELVGKSVYDFVIEDKPGRLARTFLDLVETGVRKNTDTRSFAKTGLRSPRRYPLH